jgi:hypothetical protein
MGYKAGLRFPAAARYFYLLHSVQTFSRAYLVSNPMSFGRCSPGIKQPGREADHSLPSSSEDKNVHVFMTWCLINYAQGQLHLLLKFINFPQLFVCKFHVLN